MTDMGAGAPLPVEYFKLTAVLGGKKPYRGIQGEMRVTLSSWDLPRKLRDNWNNLKNEIEKWMADYEGK